ncbi:hypothetical protein HDU83_001376 [Entophlyctis luteolus]|nr:hypothetical protein HDU82_008209 [Entophlyctis luteolus]KAJ3348360.1 hypothetical protein HDU83_001376 [Entophlyctis luteolus]KAJ3381782.1 hypothetical protein HDU84_004855 [Entophlyctis sp. JEL0112]
MGSHSLVHRIKGALAPVAFALFLPFLTLAELGLALASSAARPRSKFHAAGKVVLITGASSGIGAALALHYARDGAVLVLLARRPAELDAVSRSCLDAGAKEVVCEALDVADEPAVKAAVHRAGTKFGKIDMVVLNAGISMGEYVNAFDSAEVWRRMMEINYIGFVSPIVYSLPYLKKADRGRVVGVSSILGLASGPLRTGFCASKFAMKGFLDSIRLEEPSINFTMVYPNRVATESNRNRIGNKGKLLSDGDADAQKKIMSPEVAADLIADAVDRGAHDDIISFEGNFLYYLKDVFPRFRDLVMKMSLESKSKDN